MSRIGSPSSTLDSDGVEYPTGDGLPMAETGVHVLLMLTLIAMLREHFRLREDVYVIGNIFLYFEKGNPEARRSPDVMVVKGVPATPERDSFMVWEEGAVPSVVIELTSRITADEDFGPKKLLYEQLGVREYFLFDPNGEYLDQPLMGFRLIATAENGDLDEMEVHHRYEPLTPFAGGALPSAELGLTLVPRGEKLLLLDPRTGKYLPTPADAYVERLRQQTQITQLDKQLAEARRELQKTGNDLREKEDQLLKQKKDLEELAALRAELAQLKAQSPPSPPSPPSQET